MELKYTQPAIIVFGRAEKLWTDKLTNMASY